VRVICSASYWIWIYGEKREAGREKEKTERRRNKLTAKKEMVE